MTQPPAALADALEPCPFCGEPGHVVTRSDPKTADIHRCECSECFCELSDWHEDRADAIAAWNRRAPRATSQE